MFLFPTLSETKERSFHLIKCFKLDYFPYISNSLDILCKKADTAPFYWEKESREFLFACILSHHFLMSLRLTLLATECLTQHMLSLKQKSCGFYAPIFQQLPQPVKHRLFSQIPTGFRVRYIHSNAATGSAAVTEALRQNALEQCHG